jgi:hypothetical protein
VSLAAMRLVDRLARSATLTEAPSCPPYIIRAVRWESLLRWGTLRAALGHPWPSWGSAWPPDSRVHHADSMR